MARIESWQLMLLPLLFFVFLHLLVSPFTKVEESFNMQATHDIMTYGVPTSNINLKFRAQYDHMEFPGAVPRTFIGALLLAGFAKPFAWLWPEMDQQRLVRALLGTFNFSALATYAYGVRRAFGKDVAFWYTLLQASQFHIFYYASRPLPNMFAFGLSTFALRCLLLSPTDTTVMKIKHTRLAFYILTLATVIFRVELALLLASHALYMLFKASTNQARLTLLSRTIIPAGLTGVVVGLALTVSIDTFFWQTPMPIWPELSAFISNVFPTNNSLGASAWGTSPWYWYLTSAVPRLVLNPILLPLLLLLPLTTPVLRQTSLDLLVPTLSYILLYSILPHKETRFLFPIVPSLTTLAALSASHIATLVHRSKIYTLFTTLLLITTIGTALLSHLVLLPLSALTYPGAHALLTLHSRYHNTQPHIAVHLDNLALQTGVTRFLQLPPPPKPFVILPGSRDGRRPTFTSGATLWRYDKTENQSLLSDASFWEGFDFVIVEEPGSVPGEKWEVVHTEYMLGKTRVVRPDAAAAEAADKTEELVGQLYGEVVAEGYKIFREVVRDGWGLQRIWGRSGSWTGGWWLVVGLEPRLYVLKKSDGMGMNAAAAAAAASSI